MYKFVLMLLLFCCFRISSIYYCFPTGIPPLKLTQSCFYISVCCFCEIIYSFVPYHLWYHSIPLSYHPCDIIPLLKLNQNCTAAVDICDQVGSLTSANNEYLKTCVPEKCAPYNLGICKFYVFLEMRGIVSLRTVSGVLSGILVYGTQNQHYHAGIFTL